MLDKARQWLSEKKWVKTAEWNFKEIDILNKHCFITAKNVAYLVNLSVPDFKNRKNKWLKGIKEWIDTNCPGDIIPYSAEYEKEVFERYVHMYICS